MAKDIPHPGQYYVVWPKSSPYHGEGDKLPIPHSSAAAVPILVLDSMGTSQLANFHEKKDTGM